ncbi:unnamed protein product [Boreogadus saida]
MNVQTHNGTASPRTGQLNPWLSPEEVVKQPQDDLRRMAVLGQGLPSHYTPQRALEMNMILEMEQTEKQAADPGPGPLGTAEMDVWVWTETTTLNSLSEARADSRNRLQFDK